MAFPTDLFPHGVATYLVGGVFIGLGIGSIYFLTGRIAGIASLGAGNWPFVFAFAGMLIGAYLQGVAASRGVPLLRGA